MYGIRKTSMFSEKSDHECPVLHVDIFKLHATASRGLFLKDDDDDGLKAPR